MIERRSTKTGVRYEVRLRGPDGKERSRTLRTRKDAERYEREKRSELDKGSWIDPRHAQLTFEKYSKQWIAERHDLSPGTIELYRRLLRRHIRPTFGEIALGKITPGAVRTWNAALAQAKPIVASKAYRLMRQILGTAVADELISRNPCLVKGAGQEDSPERPVASIAEVDAIAAAMPDDLRIAVLLAAWCQLRRAEVIGLERRDVDLLHGTVRVERTANHLKGGMVLGPPKSEAGLRTLSVPPHVLKDIDRHLDEFVGGEPSCPLLTGPNGGRVRPATLQKAWEAARLAGGRTDLHFHDLRHSGATWAATTGATTRELMARVGHSSPAAALRYQHATEDRDTALAEALSELVQPADVTSISV